VVIREVGGKSIYTYNVEAKTNAEARAWGEEQAAAKFDHDKWSVMVEKHPDFKE
jgi:hypothetical protein